MLRNPPPTTYLKLRLLVMRYRPRYCAETGESLKLSNSGRVCGISGNWSDPGQSDHHSQLRTKRRFVLIPDSSIEKFKASHRGHCYLPSEQGYDAARTVPNAMIDRRPAIIARCSGAADVVACVQFAREHDLLIAVRGGGHSVAGKSVCDDGIMIDLSAMKGIRVDPASRIVRAETGLTLGEFDRETQAFGLATTLGVVSKTGIAGLTLGGGWGHLHAKLAWPWTTSSGLM